MATETIKINGKVETKTRHGMAVIVCDLGVLPAGIRDMTNGQQIEVECGGKAYTVTGRSIGFDAAYLATTEPCQSFSRRELAQLAANLYNEGYRC